MFMLDIGKRVSNQDMDKWNGQVVLHMKGNLKMDSLMGKVFIIGKMGEYISENGKIVKCMGKVACHTLMADVMKEATRLIWNTV